MGNKRKGLKRHEALYGLSHHHTNALFMALKLRQAGTEKSRHPVDTVIRDLQEFWEFDGNAHFREEEEILLPAFAQYADINRPEIKELLLEHVTIRAQIAELQEQEDAPDIPLMHELGTLLESHIRKEERIVFPMIEKTLPEEKLRELGEVLHDHG